ncbi:Nn.00g107830.m01.CDS01 [Neocucurbitaria sp. VM-36]
MSSTPNRGHSSRRSNRSAGGGGAPLNASANEFSPQAADVGCHHRKQSKTLTNYPRPQRRQALRETSERDSPGSRTQHGAIGAPVPAAQRSGTVSAYFGGGAPPQGASGRATSAIPSALQALLAIGPITVDVASERQRPGANQNRPAFLNGVVFDPNNQDQWYKVVLPYVAGLTFNLESSSDVHFLGPVFASRDLPDLYTAVTKLEFPGFLWFSGLAHNRPHNPYWQMARHLPALRALSFKLHTQGVTTSAFGERQMLAIEAVDPERSKERKCMRPQDVVAYYELDALFELRSLRRLRIEYIESSWTAHYTKNGNPVDVLQAIQAWLGQGFSHQGQAVQVDLVCVERGDDM